MRWLKLLKDYYMSVSYHPTRVIERFSMKVEKKELVCDVHKLARVGIHLIDSVKGSV